MKYALIEGQRREAQRGISGECPVCGSAMLAKCGEHRVWHWAHRGKRNCDHWWEPETDWHRTWKNCFPAEWQEHIQWAENGEKHIADVKTDHGVAIEFQHSYLRPEERRTREAFYRRMLWVVDGLRRIRDRQQFFEKLRSGRIIGGSPLTIAVDVGKCALLRDWADSRVPVFFDFGEINDLENVFRFGIPVLWRLVPGKVESRALLAPVHRAHFVESLLVGRSIKGMDYSKLFEYARRVQLVRRTTVMVQAPYRERRRKAPLSFKQHMARQHRKRSQTRL